MSNKKKSGGRSREYWVELVGKFEQSGLMQRVFCESEGVRESSFRYWLYRLRQQGMEKSKSQGRFVQVVPSTGSGATTCKLRLGSAELTFSELPPIQYIGSLLRLMDR